MSDYSPIDEPGDADSDELSPDVALRKTRQVWWMLLVGMALFVGGAMYLQLGRPFTKELPPLKHEYPPLTKAEIEALEKDYGIQYPELPARWPHVVWLVGSNVVALSIGLYSRMQAYKANWTGDVISPDGYFRGTSILMSMCGMAIVGSMPPWIAAGGSVWLLLLVFPAVLIFLCNYPDGRPMHVGGSASPAASDSDSPNTDA